MIKQLREIFAEILPHTDVSAITESTRLFEDLQFDSITMMTLLTFLEERFGFRFHHFVGFETVSDICGYLECRV